MLCHVSIATFLHKILLVDATLYRYLDGLVLRITFKLIGKEIRDDVINYWPVLSLCLDSSHR